MSSKLDKNKIFSSMATEHTLREVVTAVKATSINIGDIAFGNVNVQSDDTITHDKLDVTNTAIGVTNNKLDTINNNIEDLSFIDISGVSKLQVNIAGQTIAVNGLNSVARESTLSNIDEKIPNLLSDNGSRLLVNTEGQSVGITNFPENQLVTVNSGSINVANFPSNQQVFGSVNVSNQITGFGTETTLNSVKTSIDNKRLQFVDDSVSVTGSSVSISNPVTVSNSFTLDGTTQTTNSKLDTLNTTIINKRLSSATDSVSVSNMIGGFNLEGTQLEVSGKLTALKTAVEQKRLDQNVDSVSVFLANHSTDTLQTAGNNKLDTISSNIVNKRLNKLQDSIDVSGQTLNVNTISGFSTSELQIETNDDLEKIVDKKGDIQSSIYYDDGAPVWADTTPTPNVYYQDANGWQYRNTNAGNAMNLYYFNGANEIKTLSQVTGQYAVVTNLSTKVNSKMVFAVFTKSATSFFTTRVTRSTNTSSFMAAGGKYLLYWGDVPDDIFPSLPRINFTNVVTTGPANPTEEILSVSLNSDSGAVAGDLDIFIESLGVVFGTQSRVYNLLGYTEYFYQRNINNNLSLVKNNTDKNKYNGEDLKTVISNAGFNCNNIADTPLITGFATQSTLADIKLNTDKNKYADEDLKTVVSNAGFNCNNIADTPLITGFSTSALQTAGNASLSDIKTNSDKLKYVNDDLKAVISNTGFDAKIRDKDNNAITSTAVGLDGIRGLDVVLKNGTPADPISVLIDPTNVLTCAVNNFPAEYPINAGGALSSAVGALYVNLRDTTGNAYGITGAPLVVQNSNNISGFALETGGNLASIKTNSDKFKFEGDFLKTQVNNGLTNPFIVTTTNPSTNYANETGGNLASIKANTDKNTYDPSGNLKINLSAGTISVGSVNIKDTSGNNIYADPSGNLKTNIQNSSLDTHCYGSSNGTNWHHLSTDANGQLNVHSKLQDGAGTDLTSTLNGAKQSLDVNVSNTVPVSGTFYPATQPVSGAVNIGSGAVTAGISIISTEVQPDARGLVTASCLYAKAPALSGVPSTPITAILNGARAYLETRDEDAVAELTSIDTGVGTTNTRLTTTNTTLSAISNKMVTQSNAGATVGLNVYNIYPNKLIYRMAGSASAPVVNQFLGPEALAFDGNTFNIGLNYPSNFNIYLTAAGTRSVDLDYIDANGNRILSTITINNTDQVRLSNAININNMNWTPTSGNVDTKLRAIARTGVYRNQLSTFLSGAGVITVPNGYIGVVSNLYYYAAVGDDVYMIVKDKYNNHKTSRFMPQPISAAGKYTNVGDINEPLIAGDSVYFLSGQSGSGQKYLNAIVTMEPL